MQQRRRLEDWLRGGRLEPFWNFCSGEGSYAYKRLFQHCAIWTIAAVEVIMGDSYTRERRGPDGKRSTGACAREERIKAEGGVDRIKEKEYMRGYVDGYGACRQDAADRLDALEARVTELEGKRSRA